LGYTVAKIFEDGEDAPAIKSFTGQTKAECGGENRIGAIVIPPVGSRNMTKRIEVGLLSVADRKFKKQADDVTGVAIEVARRSDYLASGGRPRWDPLGRAILGTDSGVWVFDWNLSSFTAPEYVVRAVVTRKGGKVQEARGVAAAPAY